MCGNWFRGSHLIYNNAECSIWKYHRGHRTSSIKENSLKSDAFNDVRYNRCWCLGLTHSGIHQLHSVAMEMQRCCLSPLPSCNMHVALGRAMFWDHKISRWFHGVSWGLWVFYWALFVWVNTIVWHYRKVGCRSEHKLKTPYWFQLLYYCCLINYVIEENRIFL